MKSVGAQYTFDTASKPIGRGAFSKVYLGMGANNERVAIKVIELPDKDGKMKHIVREIDIMRDLKHDNVVSLHYVGCEQGQHSVTLFIVMEYCELGDMSTLPKLLTEERCQGYMRQLAHGLRYLHRKGVVHRDLKPQNILLTSSDTVKIADFTFARHVEKAQLLQTMCGTPLYIAPEVLNGKTYNYKCDLWSLGIICYSFVYGAHPLGTVKTQVELVTRMNNVKITFPQKLVTETYEKNNGRSILCRTVHVFSDECVRMLQSILVHDPAARATWDTLETDVWLDMDFQHEKREVVHASSAPPRVCEFPMPLPPRFVKAKTAPRPMIAAPVQNTLLSSSDSLGFKMSDSGSEKSVVIEDYATSGDKAPVFISKPKRASLLSRSIETLQTIFN